MLDDVKLAKIKQLESEKLCEFISNNLEKLTDDDIRALEDIIIEKKDIVSINWFMEEVGTSKKLEEAYREAIYNLPIEVETLSDEEVENLKAAMEEYNKCQKAKKVSSNTRR